MSVWAEIIYPTFVFHAFFFFFFLMHAFHWVGDKVHWKNLSLTEEEDVKLSLSRSKNIRRKEYILAAKFLTKRALNVEAIGRTFKPLWRAKIDFKVREAGDHILLFVFELEADAERVLANEPWTFDKHAVLL